MQINWIMTVIKQLIDNKYTGSVRINFFQGGLTNVNMDYSIKEGQYLTESKQEEIHTNILVVRSTR